MSEQVTWNNDIDYDTIWFVVRDITNQISGRGIKALQEKLEDEGLSMTGELKKSLFMEVRQKNNVWITEAAMQFEMYGRFRDMKSTTYTDKIPIQGMKNFVDNLMAGKGTNAAQHHALTDLQLKNRRGPVERDQIAWRIAWAMAKARLKEPFVVRKGKGWYIKNYMREIYGEIEVNMKAAVARAVLNTMKKALQDRK